MVADANKYSFVWRKSIEKFDAKLDEKAQSIFDELIQANVDLALTEEGPLANLEAASQKLDQEINNLNQTIETEKASQDGSPRKRRRRTLKHLQHIIKTDLIPRKRKYETAKATFGDRNSFSKTDHDATFMRMKEDPMNNGQLKSGYNLQIGTQCQHVLYYTVNQRPTDQRTLQPFLKTAQKSRRIFRYIVADAGYGSESNYDFILQEFGATPLIPYTMYLKEQTRKYLKDVHKVMNWRYDHQTDSFTDDHNVHFSFKALSTRTDKYGFTRHTRVYEADEQPENNDIDYSLNKGGNQRQIQVNPHWEMQKNVIRLKLSSETGKSIY
ncbi:transposase [Secundilactobacillus folii]|uniref:Transposase n=1 Tax=Secundilactobacillus folii TaxID=2678357 RepID=A0A7X3C3F6_9LACO|nr:transposase [Secundilactobacillus folii]MTV82244.1 transposase [Secundilactobacillus folii]